MADFDTIEKSAEAGAPIEFMVFEFAGTTTRYVNHTEQLELGGKVYTPSVVSSDSNRATGGVGSSELKVSLPANSPVATPFRGGTPRDVLKLTILLAHLQDDGSLTDSIVWVRGTHTTAVFNGTQCTFSFETGLGALASEGLQEKYSTTCPHVVYGSKCGAALNGSVSEDVTVSDVSPDGRTVTLAGSVTPGAYVGGVLILSGERATVANNSATILSLVNPLRLAGGGSTGTLARGCDHVMSTCATVFENLANFGGTPYIPLINLYEKGLK